MELQILYTQGVTVNNPGVLTLQWSATSATNDGSSWLSMYPLSGMVAKGSSQPVTISVNTSECSLESITVR